MAEREHRSVFQYSGAMLRAGGRLPTEVWSTVFSFLTLPTLKIAGRVSRQFQSLSIQEHQKSLSIPLRLQPFEAGQGLEARRMYRDVRNGVKALESLLREDRATKVQALYIYSARGPRNAISYNDLVDVEQFRSLIEILPKLTRLKFLQFSIKSETIPKTTLLQLHNLKQLQCTASTVRQARGLTTLEALTIINNGFETFTAPFIDRTQRVSRQITARVQDLITREVTKYTVEEMPSLERLQILDENLAGGVRTSLIDFSTLPKLKILSIRSKAEFPRYRLTAIGDPSKLEVLHLTHVLPDPEWLQAASSLRHLILEGLHITQNMQLRLSNLETLEILECDFNSSLLDVSQCPQLRNYCFYSSSSLSGEDLHALQKLRGQIRSVVVGTANPTKADSVLALLKSLASAGDSFRCMIMAELSKDQKLWAACDCKSPGMRRAFRIALKTFDQKKCFLQTRLATLDNTVGDPDRISSDWHKSFMPLVDMY